ncbi:MAG: DUF881 domain-containing protein [Sarcina sp.]
MKKISSQIPIGIMCTVLGFMVVYQLRSIEAKNSSSLSLSDKEEVMLEIDGLKIEKEELVKKNKELADELDEIEKNAVAKGELDKSIKESLDKTRMLLGQDDVVGEGIKLTLTLKSPLVIGQNPNIVQEKELVHLINILKFSGAEAISINDYRITGQTGFKNAGDFIWVGDEGRLWGQEKIEIKAIGNVEKLKKGLVFQVELEFGALINYDNKIEEVKNLEIKKSNVALQYNYLKNAKREE